MLTKSVKKALRQNIKRRVQNIQKNKKIKDLLKEVKGLVSLKKPEEAKKILPQIYKALDKAAKVKLMKKNTVDRKKSRLTKLVNKSTSPQ